MDETLSEFKKLIETAEKLMGPEGCPWDREQTLLSMRGSVLEEACEVIEAIDENDDKNLKEELGDLLYNVIFFCFLAEKEKKFSLKEVISLITQKLIFRHPHVFGEKVVGSMAEVMEQWEKLKKEEKSHRESLLDGIPKALPALSKGYKMAKKMKRKSSRSFDLESEEEIGAFLWDLICYAQERGVQPEHALRKELITHEKAFREKEKNLFENNK